MITSKKRRIKYDTRFSQDDISQLSATYCPAMIANRYNKRFNSYEIANLFKLGCTPEEVNAYNEKFSAEEISLFCWTGYPPNKVNKYNKRFNKEEILNFCSKAIKPEIVNGYDKRFNTEEILYLIGTGCISKVANKYAKRFRVESISNFFRAKQSPEIVNEYNERFYTQEILSLIRFGCSAKIAEDYILKGLETKEIIQLFKFKKENKLGTINEYINSFFELDDSYRFDRSDIFALYEAGCSLQEIKDYNSQFNGLEIAILYEMGLKSDKISDEKQEKLFNLFRKIVWLSKEKEKNFKKFNFLGTGISGVVLLKENNACKFSEKINEEYKLLKKIHCYHKSNQINIIKLKDEPKENIALEIEYIQGDSLENILRKKIPKINHGSNVILKKPFVLSKNKSVKYGSDIMNGLIEMRQAGVWYHRDIRPANILIDEKNDKAVIIDFGIATTDRHALPQDNRRYGGVNDLVSLGQVMYKMATGNHIFAKSKSMESTTHAQEIKDYRDEIYSDKTGKLLEMHLKQIDETVKDEQLGTLIKACLTAKNYHYKKIQRMFKELISDNGY